LLDTLIKLSEEGIQQDEILGGLVK